MAERLIEVMALAEMRWLGVYPAAGGLASGPAAMEARVTTRAEMASALLPVAVMGAQAGPVVDIMTPAESSPVQLAPGQPASAPALAGAARQVIIGQAAPMQDPRPEPKAQGVLPPIWRDA